MTFRGPATEIPEVPEPVGAQPAIESRKKRLDTQPGPLFLVSKATIANKGLLCQPTLGRLLANVLALHGDQQRAGTGRRHQDGFWPGEPLDIYGFRTGYQLGFPHRSAGRGRGDSGGSVYGGAHSGPFRFRKFGRAHFKKYRRARAAVPGYPARRLWKGGKRNHG